MELVDLYDCKLFADQVDEHIQAAFHYLTLAQQVQSQQHILFDTLELQNNGTLTGLDKLPTFVTEAILETTTLPRKENSSPLPTSRATEQGISSAQAISARSMLDAPRVVNYFVKLLRQKMIIPSCGNFFEDVSLLLHDFLLQYHSSDAKLCCLQELLPVPTADPEIKAGLICTHWGRDTTPALSSHNIPAITLYYTLGTTKIDCSVDKEQAKQCMTIFASVPLLHKQTGLQDLSLHTIRQQLSRLRSEMEDEESLVIDRTVFPSKFTHILKQIQDLLRPSIDNSPLITDRFGNTIVIPCTREVVSCLENLFNVERAVQVNNHVLCYFLRDLLDTTTE